MPGNALGDAGAKAVAAIVRCAPKLEILDLSGCGITDSVGGRAIAEALGYVVLRRKGL